MCFQIHGHNEPFEAAHGQKGDDLHSHRYLDRGGRVVAADATLLQDLHPELREWRSTGHMLRRFPEQGRQWPQLRRIFVSLSSLTLPSFIIDL